MKGIFKLFPVAAAMLALASCSNDEQFGESQTIEKVNGGLTVSVEGFGGTTRQANVANGNSVVWQNGDLINVYDNDLTKYDEYSFEDTKFVGINDPNETRISSTKFALFPADRVDYAGWTAKDGTKAVMTIPQLIIYDEEREIETADGTTAYVSNLPMWGGATGTYPEAKVDLKLLTAAFKINIKDAFANNITFLKVEAQDDQPIVGAFEANLGDENPILAMGAPSLITDHTMYVDLRNVPSYLTYIYLPILARHYDYLKVMVTSVKGTEAAPLEENGDLIVSDLETVLLTEDATTGWKTIRNWEAGVTFERANIQPLSKETQYNLDNITTCEMVTKALQQYSNYTGELVLNIAKNDPFAITREGDVDDYTIYVPEMKATKVTINVQNANGINASYANARMEIIDADMKKPFTGTIELNAADIQTNDLDLTINLPKTSFSLMGFDGGTNNLDEIDVKNVQTLTFGGEIDGAPVNTVIKNTSTVNVSTAKKVIVADNAKVEADLDLVETKNFEEVTIMPLGEVSGGALTNLSVLNGDIHLQGKADAIYQYGSKSTLYIGEDEADGSAFSVYSIGKIEIANLNESEAIRGALNALGNNTITLKQGYIKKIGMSRQGGFLNPLYGGKYLVKSLADLSVSDKTNKLVKVTFAPGEGLTAIAEVADYMLKHTTGGKTYNYLEFTNESTWSGATIDALIYPDYVTPAALANIYTASELASIDNVATDIALYNDINLGTNQAWTIPTLTQNFTGLDPRYATTDVHKGRLDAVTACGVTSTGATDKGIHTIKNLYLDNSDNDVAYGHGLFAGLNPAVAQTIGDVIIDGVQTNLVKTTANKIPGNIGVLIGNAESAQDLTVSNVWVKNVSNFGNGTAKKGSGTTIQGIRGISTLIGAVGAAGTGDLTIEDNKIESSTITGQAYLGGLIGWYRGTGDVTITDNVIGTAFSVPAALQPGDYDYGSNVFGTVGIAIGQVDNLTTTVDITTSADDTDNVTNNRASLGFKYNFIYEGSTKYGFHGNNEYVGFSRFTDTQLIIDAQLYDCTTVKGNSKAETEAVISNFNTYIRWTPWEE